MTVSFGKHSKTKINKRLAQSLNTYLITCHVSFITKLENPKKRRKLRVHDLAYKMYVFAIYYKRYTEAGLAPNIATITLTSFDYF